MGEQLLLGLRRADRRVPPVTGLPEIKFRHPTDSPNGPVVFTLWPEKKWEDGWYVGWCPELERTMAIHPANVVGEDDES